MADPKKPPRPVQNPEQPPETPGPGATGGSRGTQDTGGAGYTNPGGSTGGEERDRASKGEWPFKHDIKKP